jgi:hypothetical protein
MKAAAQHQKQLPLAHQNLVFLFLTCGIKRLSCQHWAPAFRCLEHSRAHEGQPVLRPMAESTAPKMVARRGPKDDNCSGRIAGHAWNTFSAGADSSLSRIIVLSF